VNLWRAVRQHVSRIARPRLAARRKNDRETNRARHDVVRLRIIVRCGGRPVASWAVNQSSAATARATAAGGFRGGGGGGHPHRGPIGQKHFPRGAARVSFLLRVSQSRNDVQQSGFGSKERLRSPGRNKRPPPSGSVGVIRLVFLSSTRINSSKSFCRETVTLRFRVAAAAK